MVSEDCIWRHWYLPLHLLPMLLPLRIGRCRRSLTTCITANSIRRWLCQQIVPCEHPAYWLFDQCLANVFAGISVPAPLILKEHQKTEPHVRGYDEDDAVLRQSAVFVVLRAMPACIKKASVSEHNSCKILSDHMRRQGMVSGTNLGLFPT